jgi:hypothetical protein
MVNKINKKFNINLDVRYPHHNIDAYLKSDFIKCIEEFKDEREISMQNRFRNEDDFQRTLISYYCIAVNRAVFKIVKPTRALLKMFSKSNEIDSMTLSIYKKNLDAQLEKSNPKLFCINDSERATNEDRQRAKQFLAKRFPNKSSFEN